MNFHLILHSYAIVIKKSPGGIFYKTCNVIKSKMAAGEVMKCTLCYIFATNYDINKSEESFYTFSYTSNLFLPSMGNKSEMETSCHLFCVPKMVAGLIQ